VQLVVQLVHNVLIQVIPALTVNMHNLVVLSIIHVCV
jgi:hypothetical protein